MHSWKALLHSKLVEKCIMNRFERLDGGQFSEMLWSSAGHFDLGLVLWCWVELNLLRKSNLIQLYSTLMTLSKSDLKLAAHVFVTYQALLFIFSVCVSFYLLLLQIVDVCWDLPVFCCVNTGYVTYVVMSLNHFYIFKNPLIIWGSTMMFLSSD